jgi:AAA domain
MDATTGFTMTDEPPPQSRRQSVPPLRIVTAAELLAMQVPARDYALAPVLPMPGLAMLYGPRGTGKTYAALSIALAIAAGGTALRWRAPSPRRVLYIDGEMPAGQLQERVARLIRAAPMVPGADDGAASAPTMPRALSMCVRWWWICPATGRRVSKLYLPNGGVRFLSHGPGAYRLAYASQRHGRLDRDARAKPTYQFAQQPQRRGAGIWRCHQVAPQRW